MGFFRFLSQKKCLNEEAQMILSKKEEEAALQRFAAI